METIIAYVIVVIFSLATTLKDLIDSDEILKNNLVSVFKSGWLYLLFLIQGVVAAGVFYALGKSRKFHTNSILDGAIVGLLFPAFLKSKFVKSEKGIIEIYDFWINVITHEISEYISISDTTKRTNLTKLIADFNELEKLERTVYSYIDNTDWTQEQKEAERQKLEAELKEIDNNYPSPTEETAQRRDNEKKRTLARYLLVITKARQKILQELELMP